MCFKKSPLELEFVSSVLDATIIVPIIDACLGYDIITGEDLNDTERGFKILGAFGSCIAIALALPTGGGSLSGRQVLSTVLHIMVSDAAGRGAAYMASEADLPVWAQVAIGIGVDILVYKGTNGFFAKVSGQDIPISAEVAENINQAQGQKLNSFKLGDIEISGENLTKENIIAQLEGKTAQSNKIAQGLRNGDIKLNILGDELFDYALGAEDAIAVARGNQIYIRKSSTSIMTDVVHEGTHVLDFNAGFGAEGISVWSWEKRAFFYERQFQIVTGSPVEYSTIEEMLMNIWTNYSNEIYMPY